MSRVLIVDDAEILAHLLATLLGDAGHDPVEVSEHAERLLDPADPLWEGVQVLLTDLHGVNGLDILTTAAAYHPSIHRLVLTGYEQGTKATEHVEQLAHRLLLKPADVLNIVGIIEDLA